MFDHFPNLCKLTIAYTDPNFPWPETFPRLTHLRFNGFYLNGLEPPDYTYPTITHLDITGVNHLPNWEPFICRQIPYTVSLMTCGKLIYAYPYPRLTRLEILVYGNRPFSPYPIVTPNLQEVVFVCDEEQLQQVVMPAIQAGKIKCQKMIWKNRLELVNLS